MNPQEFSKVFFTQWYAMPDDMKQIIILPEYEDKNKEEVFRLPEKVTKKKSLDVCVEQIAQGEQCNILFSLKKIQQALPKDAEINDKSIQDFVHSWTKHFHGCSNLLIACRIIYHKERKKHPKGMKDNKPKIIRKITGYIVMV